MPPFDAPEPLNPATTIADSHVPDFSDEIGSRGIVSAVGDHPGQALATVAVAGIAAVALLKGGQALTGAIERYVAAGAGAEVGAGAYDGLAAGVRASVEAGDNILDSGIYAPITAMGRGVPDIAPVASQKWLPSVPGSYSDDARILASLSGSAERGYVSEFPAPLHTKLVADILDESSSADSKLGRVGYFSPNSPNFGDKAVWSNLESLGESAPPADIEPRLRTDLGLDPAYMRYLTEKFGQPLSQFSTATRGDVGAYTTSELTEPTGLGRPGFIDEIRSGKLSEFFGDTQGGPSVIEAVTPKSVSQRISQLDFASAIRRIQFWK